MTLHRLNIDITPYLNPVIFNTLDLTSSYSHHFSFSPINTFSLFPEMKMA
jgi:hypothetical protein